MEVICLCSISEFRTDFFLLFFLSFQLVALSLIDPTTSRNLRATSKRSFLAPDQMRISPILRGRQRSLLRVFNTNNGNKSRQPEIVLIFGVNCRLRELEQWSLHRQVNI